MIGGEKMKKKLFLGLFLAVFSFGLMTGNVYAQTEEVGLAAKETEDASRWEAVQPERKVTSDGLIIDYDLSGIDIGPYWFEGEVTVTITIPEDYELDTVVLAPDVFEEITKAIYGENEENFEMNNTFQPGDGLTIHFVINNLSKYTYNYDETSFEIFPKEDIVYDKLSEEEPSSIEETPLFNGETVKENYHFYRTYNTALKALMPKASNTSITDEAIDAALRAQGYQNGFVDYTQYLLDFYNAKYHTNYTRLDQFPDGIIREILGENDPFLTINDAYKAAKIFTITESDTIEDILWQINRNTGKNYQSVEEYLVDYYNEQYGTLATRLVDLSEEALDNFFASQGQETGSPYLFETNPDILALSYDFFYNKNLSFGFEGDSITNENSEEYSIGEYMRDETKGDNAIMESVGTLTPNSISSMNNTQFKNNGLYTLNSYLGYEFQVNLQWTYSALKGTVIAKYIDIYGNVLADDVITTDMVGRDYATQEKIFSGYTLVQINGEEIGKYIDGKIVVVYIYAPVIPEDEPGTGSTEGYDSEILPPNTGIIETNNTMSYALILILSSLGLYTLALKKGE